MAVDNRFAQDRWNRRDGRSADTRSEIVTGPVPKTTRSDREAWVPSILLDSTASGRSRAEPPSRRTGRLASARPGQVRALRNPG
jgi:hypothetical protein